MKPFEIIQQVQAIGGRLALEDGKLIMEAKVPLHEGLRREIRLHKAAIMVALGAPFDTVVSATLGEIRPELPAPLQRLPDEKLLALVNWAIIAAWERTFSTLLKKVEKV